MRNPGDLQLRTFHCPSCGKTHDGIWMEFNVGLILEDRCDYRIICPANQNVVWVGRKDWHDLNVDLLAITKSNGYARVSTRLQPLLQSQLRIEEDGIHLSLYPTS